jgi:hypothetical protein
MTPVELAARYRGYAIRCLLIEKHQFNVSDRVALADIAKALASLADCVEKSEAVFGLFGALDYEQHDHTAVAADARLGAYRAAG